MSAGSWAELELLDQILQNGTLSGAAKAFGVDQTTISRRLASLEKQLGLSLFDRVQGRLVPTPPTAQILERLRTIKEEAKLSMSTLKSTTTELQGRVRVTSVGFILSHILAPALASFLERPAGLAIELHADDQNLSFEHRETDIALRLSNTGEDSTRIKHLGMLRYCLCRPKVLSDMIEPLPIVRYEAGLAHLPEMRKLDELRPHSKVALYANRLDVLTEAALQVGAEIMLPRGLLGHSSAFVAVDEAQTTVERPLYLLIHPERIKTPSVALVARWVEASVKNWLSRSELP